MTINYFTSGVLVSDLINKKDILKHVKHDVENILQPEAIKNVFYSKQTYM